MDLEGASLSFPQLLCPSVAVSPLLPVRHTEFGGCVSCPGFLSLFTPRIAMVAAARIMMVEIGFNNQIIYRVRSVALFSMLGI